MSRVVMTMPQLGETMEHGIVATWFVQEGESFSRGDPIIEFETDKTAVEYPALGDGVLVEHKVTEGDQVDVGAPIAIVDIGDGPNWLDTGEANEHAESQSVGQPGVENVDEITDVDKASNGNAQLSPRDNVIRATPVARRVARQHGIDLASVNGTGRRGRIEHGDVAALVSPHAAPQRDTAFAVQKDTDLSYAGDLAYQSLGPEEGHAFLLLHGFAADHTSWALLSRALAREGCRTTTVDLPGHGASTSEASDAASLSSGLELVLAEAVSPRGSDKQNSQSSHGCHLVAHSMGAIPAVQLAISDLKSGRQPGISSLTLIAPAGLGVSIDTQFIQGMASPASRADVTHLLRRLSDWPQSLSSDAMDALYERLKQGRLRTLATSLVSENRQKVDIHDALGSIASRIPIRLIVGHADRILDWQDALRVHPKVAVHHLPTAGHMPHWDEPRTVADILLSVTR